MFEIIANLNLYMSRDMRFPTMWYVRPTKPEVSLMRRLI